MNVPSPNTKRSGLFALALFLLLPTVGWAWGCTGHEVVALIALDQMNDAWRTRIDRVLAQMPKDYPGRYCSDTDLPRLAYFATWADDYRATHPQTAAWHYWNIPLEKTTATAMEYCEAGCVVRAIESQLSVMQDRAKSQEQRLHALLFVIHFVGDIHQPLHAEDNLDRGGNCVPIGFLRKPTDQRSQEGHSPANYNPNLHSIWDTDIVEHLAGEATRNRAAIDTYANRLNHLYSAKMNAWKKQTDPVQWALESHQVARNVAYKRLTRPIAPVHYTHAIKDCSDGETSFKYFAKHEIADNRYLHFVSNSAERRLAAAGARLAAVLEANWPGDWN